VASDGQGFLVQSARTTGERTYRLEARRWKADGRLEAVDQTDQSGKLGDAFSAPVDKNETSSYVVVRASISGKTAFEVHRLRQDTASQTWRLPISTEVSLSDIRLLADAEEHVRVFWIDRSQRLNTVKSLLLGERGVIEPPHVWFEWDGWLDRLTATRDAHGPIVAVAASRDWNGSYQLGLFRAPGRDGRPSSALWFAEGIDRTSGAPSIGAVSPGVFFIGYRRDGQALSDGSVARAGRAVGRFVTLPGNQPD
jgi:hypothetical protein